MYYKYKGLLYNMVCTVFIVQLQRHPKVFDYTVLAINNNYFKFFFSHVLVFKVFSAYYLQQINYIDYV